MLYPARGPLNPAVRARVLALHLAGEREIQAGLLVAVQNARLIRLALEEEEEEEEEEDRRRRRRRPTRVVGYVENTIPQYSHQEFKAHFRMQRASFEVRHYFQSENLHNL